MDPGSARLEPLSSEDMALLGAVASQAATALENARLYGQLRVKADEIERLRQFSDSVVESLSDGLFVIDLDDRVLRWNRRLEQLFQFDRTRAIGRRLSALFPASLVDPLIAARRDTPDGATLLRVPLASGPAELSRPLLVNAGIAPFQTADGIKAGWIIVIEDVTDRASLEEQLRVSENEISGAFQNITSDFIANLKIILNNVNLNFSEQYFLGIRVGTDSEMSPRLNLTSSPYAYMAQNVSVGGIIFDSNIDAGTRNFTTTGTGFFGCAPAS